MESLADQLATLGHPKRLDLFRLLMRRYPDELPAGEIARIMALKPNTASVYLSALRDAGLIAMRRDGTSLLYSIDMTGAQALTNGLFTDCCQGRPDLCSPSAILPPARRHPMSKTYSVLFICVGNSARSIFAESILRHEAGNKFVAYSAGVTPYSELNPFAVELLQSKGHDTGHLRSKTVEEFQGPDAPHLDFVFTVCDLAANEVCPPWPGQPISAHWGMPDPVKAEGTDAEKRLAFQQAYGLLRNRIRAFAALPFDTLDAVALQHEVDALGRDTIDA